MALVAGAASGLLAGCDILSPTSALRQRITVEVETPAGLRSGSAVVETVIRYGKSWGDASGVSIKLEGEAVAVDLPGGRTLFALLRSADPRQGDAAAYQSGLMARALRDGAVASEAVSLKGLDPKDARRAVRDSEVRLDLPEAHYPMLVTFRDINDPKSVARVDPADLTVSFGPGVRLRRITVQTTDEPVTVGIGERFSWWEQFEHKHFDGSSTVIEDMKTNDLAAHMSVGNFTTEYHK
jgi:hypothetical protein